MYRSELPCVQQCVLFPFAGFQCLKLAAELRGVRDDGRYSADVRYLADGQRLGAQLADLFLPGHGVEQPEAKTQK